MKLRESNVFSRVCLSVILSTGGGGPYVTIAHDALDLTVQVPPPNQTLDPPHIRPGTLDSDI